MSVFALSLIQICSTNTFTWIFCSQLTRNSTFMCVCSFCYAAHKTNTIKLLLVYAPTPTLLYQVISYLRLNFHFSVHAVHTHLTKYFSLSMFVCVQYFSRCFGLFYFISLLFFLLAGNR